MIASTHNLPAPSAIMPGQWVGMLGGGQLGRMFCHAAQQLGYRVAVLDPDSDSPAGAIADWHLTASYDDQQALAALSGRCQAVSTEFENIPAESLGIVAESVPVRPAAAAVHTVQDRRREKAFFVAAGVPVAPHHVMINEADIAAVPDALFPGILKVARFGYDGKGQVVVASRNSLAHAWEGFKHVPCVLEAQMTLDYEVSVVLARDQGGHVVCYPVLRNEHRDGILAVTHLTDSLPAPLTEQAQQAAHAIANQLDYVGVLCVEFFVLTDGRLVVNEVAPRPHNSGHITMDACLCSQFEQQARVLAGLPLGPAHAHSHGIMLNILGDIWYPDGSAQPVEPDWSALLAVPSARLHLYGKTEVRRGRKMGHVNLVGGEQNDVSAAAQQVAEILGIAWHD